MTTRSPLLLTACMLLACGIALPAQQTAEPSTAAKPAATCAIKRSVLANGDLQIQNADCTLKVIPKTDVEAQVDKLTELPPVKPTLVAADKSIKASAPPHEIKPEPLPEGEEDPTLRARYRESMIGYYDYYIAGYRHRQRTFEWQFLSSIIIFLLVNMLVSAGVYFAALQFREGMRVRAAALARLEAGIEPNPLLPAIPPDDTVTSFSASATGISVSSPVLGVIILVISLAFFYLYLIYVYPISELF